MERIAVIGASIAGLEFANTLSLSNHDGAFHIDLFEEHQTIGLPLKCAEGLILFHDLPPPDPRFILNEIDDIIIQFLDTQFRTLAKVMIPCKGKAWLIDRPRTEQNLAASCAERGVSINLGQRVSLCDIIDSFDYVVDASGWPSEYGRHLGSNGLPPSIGIGGAVKGDFSSFHQKFVIDFCPLFSGYFWIFPKSKDLANVGLGWHTSGPQLANPRSLLSDYLNTKIGCWHMEQIVSGSLGTKLARTVYDPARRVALIGDAAGFANPLVGEGLSSAIKSARVLAACFERDDISSYPRLIKKEVGPPYNVGFAARRVFEKLGYDAFRKAFLCMENPTLDLLHMSPSRLAVRMARHPVAFGQVAKAYLAYKAGKALWKRSSAFRGGDPPESSSV